MQRTSSSHPLLINELQLSEGGTLGLTLCPGKKQPYAMTGAWDRDLDTDLRAIADWGASAVVSLMEDRELHGLQVPNMGEAVEGLGIDWYHLPIPDQEVPDGGFESAWSYSGFRLRSFFSSRSRSAAIRSCESLP
jgi:ADP-ribosyl-[dinitrogen reductase] hydrolase